MTEPTEATTPTGRDPDLPLEAAAEVERIGMFIFRLADALYALPSNEVDLVASAQEPVKVPTAPAVILGVAQLRGRLITVVDAHRLMGLPRDVDDGTTNTRRRLVILRAGGLPVGLEADSVIGLRAIEADGLRVDTARTGDEGGFLDGEFDSEEGIVTVLGGRRMLDHLLRATGSTPAAAESRSDDG